MYRFRRAKRRYYDFIDWIKRHPITDLVITMPTENMDGKWHQYEAAFDSVRFVKQEGYYRHRLLFMAKAKMIE